MFDHALGAATPESGHGQTVSGASSLADGGAWSSNCGSCQDKEVEVRETNGGL